MLKKNRTKQIIYSGKPAFGYWIHSNSYKIAEMAGLIGVDYIIIDNEHAFNDEIALENLIRIADLSGVTPIVRVSENSPVAILKVLDAGAGGVIVPHVETPNDVKRVLEAVKFAPDGKRSLGAGRSLGYGFADIPNYYELSNREIIVIALIESISAVDNIKEISFTKGVDILHIGPSDLAQSMGYTGKPDHPLVEKAIKKILIAGKEANVAVGISANDAFLAKHRIKQGFLFIPLGKNDLTLFGNAICQMLDELR